MTATTLHASVPPPSRFLQLTEGRRALCELGATLSLWPLLKLAPRGDGHPVVVLPGLVAADSSTKLLRRYLKERGYDVHGWGLGRNLGPRDGVEDHMFRLLESLYEREGRKVSLVGWSLGGAYARLLAAKRPDLVRSVITLGSPFAADAHSTRAWRLYEWVSGRSAEDPSLKQYVHPTPPVPTTSIYSRTDGIVAWQGSVEREGPQSESIEVYASHLGLGANASVLYAVADRLAQPEDDWQPFARKGLGALVYPQPSRLH